MVLSAYGTAIPGYENIEQCIEFCKYLLIFLSVLLSGKVLLESIIGNNKFDFILGQVMLSKG